MLYNASLLAYCAPILCTTMTRTHSFPRAMEFRAEPANLPFAVEF